MTIKKKKDNRGGAGRNQGRKSLYGEPTEQIAMRAPSSKITEIKAKFEQVLKSYYLMQNSDT